MSRMCVIAAVFISGIIGITSNIVMRELAREQEIANRMIETVSKNDQRVSDDHEILMKIMGDKYGNSFLGNNGNTK